MPMRWTSMLAIYFLFWAFAVFFVLPFEARHGRNDGENRVAGTVASAPAEFNLKRIIIRVTIVATIAFLLYQVNYAYGWITVQDLDLFDPANRVG